MILDRVGPHPPPVPRGVDELVDDACSLLFFISSACRSRCPDSAPLLLLVGEQDYAMPFRVF